ncbi:MAG: SRPBCC family protein [Thermomicrobiales bacterium]
MSEPHSHIFEVYIKTTPERLWQALTDGEKTKQYFFGSRVESSWNVGEPYRNFNADGTIMIEGTILEIDKPRRLVTTFVPTGEADGSMSDPGWKLTWEITPLGDACKLLLIHDGLEKDSDDARSTFEGWSKILSGLKTLLETGQPLVIDEPSM